MPVISYFFGIYVRMYHDDHNPPHFHAEYQGHEAFVEIATGEVIAGSPASHRGTDREKVVFEASIRTIRKLASWAGPGAYGTHSWSGQ
jgi:uncharacterized protein DUF4160